MEKKVWNSTQLDYVLLTGIGQYPINNFLISIWFKTLKLRAKGALFVVWVLWLVV